MIAVGGGGAGEDSSSDRGEWLGSVIGCHSGLAIKLCANIRCGVDGSNYQERQDVAVIFGNF